MLHWNPTILLVDDEKVLLDLGRDTLREFGYRIFTAESGESALDIYQAERESIDIVILDLCMPGMGGRKCLEELRRIDPEVKVIVASGCGCENEMARVVGPGASRYIRKPYRTQEILELLEELAPRSRRPGDPLESPAR